MEIIKNIQKIQLELSKCGIIKDRKNLSQGYSFRGIDEVYNTLSPLLSEYHVTIVPNYISRECEIRATKNGTVLYNVIVKAEFDFIAPDNSKVTVKNYGEAMDSADKATNKAMSAAYKYACIQLFSIPTEGNNDADAYTPPDTIPTNIIEEKKTAGNTQQLLDAYEIQIENAVHTEQLKQVYNGIKALFPEKLEYYWPILSTRKKEIELANSINNKTEETNG